MNPLKCVEYIIQMHLKRRWRQEGLISNYPPINVPDMTRNATPVFNILLYNKLPIFVSFSSASDNANRLKLDQHHYPGKQSSAIRYAHTEAVCIIEWYFQHQIQVLCLFIPQIVAAVIPHSRKLSCKLVVYWLARITQCNHWCVQTFDSAKYSRYLAHSIQSKNRQGFSYAWIMALLVW